MIEEHAPSDKDATETKIGPTAEEFGRALARMAFQHLLKQKPLKVVDNKLNDLYIDDQAQERSSVQ